MRGKVASIMPYTAHTKDHPRVCGEKRLNGFKKPSGQGSPPRMRGKVTQIFFGLVSHGITPAYAGKSIHSDMLHSRPEDHPRVCGEKCFRCRAYNRILGSPPRMRGKVFRLWQKYRSRWITPAYAGKSVLFPLPWCPNRDHPRVCGEKARFAYSVFCSWGSPPRMRGKVMNDLESKGGVRITPAYAGKRIFGYIRIASVRDHPRVCGEK